MLFALVHHFPSVIELICPLAYHFFHNILSGTFHALPGRVNMTRLAITILIAFANFDSLSIFLTAYNKQIFNKSLVQLLWLASAQVIFIFNSKNVDLFFYQWVSKSVHLIKYSFLVLLPVCLFPFFIDLYFRTSAEVFVFSEKLHLGFSIGLYIILLKDKMLFISFVVHTIDNINFCYSKSCYNTGRWSNMNAMIQQNVLRWS